MKKAVERILFMYVRILMRLHKPTVIAVTGSVGKTTVRTYISHVIDELPGVMKRTKTYNSEIGLPLYILGIDAPAQVRNPFAWIKILITGFVRTLTFSDKIMVLEMGADHPGDIDYLCKMTPPDIGIVTAAHNVHTENFDDEHPVLNEKMVMAERAQNALLNFDEDNLVNAAEELDLDPSYFGTDAAADSRVVRTGNDYLLQLKGEQERNFSTPVVGYPAQVAMSAAAAVGQHLGMSASQIASRLEQLSAPAGRMNVLQGVIPNATVLDDSYNASEKAVIAALETLQSMKTQGGRSIAILGSMNELGDLSESAHRSVGAAVQRLGVDRLITIGKMAGDWLAESAVDAGMSASFVQSFNSPVAAGKAAAEFLEEGDVVLGKGSQNGVFAEEALKFVIDPSEASKLVRQQDFWLTKKRQQFEDMS